MWKSKKIPFWDIHIQVFMSQFQHPMLNDDVCRAPTDKQTHKHTYRVKTEETFLTAIWKAKKTVFQIEWGGRFGWLIYLGERIPKTCCFFCIQRTLNYTDTATMNGLSTISSFLFTGLSNVNIIIVEFIFWCAWRTLLSSLIVFSLKEQNMFKDKELEG